MPVELLEVPSDAPSPPSGQASLTGVLYSYTISSAVPGTIFYLTRAIGDDNRTMSPLLTGPNDEIGDIRGMTDAKGQFSLNGIPPGNYYLVVWAPYNWAPGENSSADHTPRLIELAADQRQPLGTVYVSWP